MQERRTRTLAERDPLPPPPALPRPDRDPEQGLPLWRVVDARDGVAEGHAAGVQAAVEAALQASGLLDAQVQADGTWRSAHDVLLPPPSRSTGRPCSRCCAPTRRPTGPVSTEVVERVLRSVVLTDAVDGPDGPPAIGRDGSWRLGPLSGRAAKAQAQFVGSAARQAERARRLAALDGEAERAERARVTATAAEQAAAAQQAGLRSWLRAQPSDAQVRAAVVLQQERAGVRDRARADSTRCADELRTVTADLSRAVLGLRRLGGEHGLPVDGDALLERADALAQLEVGLEALAAEAARLLTAARRVEEDGELAERDVEEAAAAAQESATSEADAAVAAQEHRLLLDTLGADVARLQAELAQARGLLAEAERTATAADGHVLALTGRRGEAVGALGTAEQRLADVRPRLQAAVAALLALREVPGLLAAAAGRDLQEEERRALDALGGSPDAVPRLAGGVLARWAEPPPAPADANAVYRDASGLAAGPAADHEPRVVPVGDALAVLARDAAGAEQPLSVVARRLAAEVERERELLTDRERTLFEEHLLGELGDALRTRRAEATDLVRGMNDLLAGVRTSQGIRVRLDWALRDDLGREVPEAVRLLDRPRGSLAPEESGRLRAALSSLIEVQRAAEPEQGYAVHLARALDYRRWSAFTVRLHRPGAATWTALTRRTPLSQGEQKVVCYLPLFAAAAAHFTSVAGAAPHAPRLILLDDAFPKIDVRTHPLLFGLLVDLDLDFVLTSERLWGDHDTVPALAVYEALRAPGERGIAQYRYTWDGRVSPVRAERCPAWLADPTLLPLWHRLRAPLERGARTTVLRGPRPATRHALSAPRPAGHRGRAPGPRRPRAPGGPAAAPTSCRPRPDPCATAGGSGRRGSSRWRCSLRSTPTGRLRCGPRACCPGSRRRSMSRGQRSPSAGSCPGPCACGPSWRPPSPVTRTLSTTAAPSPPSSCAVCTTGPPRRPRPGAVPCGSRPGCSPTPSPPRC